MQGALRLFPGEFVEGLVWKGIHVLPESDQIIATSHEFWAPKRWSSKGNVSRKSRLVKYNNLAR